MRIDHPATEAGPAGWLTGNATEWLDPVTDAEYHGQGPHENCAGNAFFEPAGATILRFDNLSASQRATFIACYLLTGDQPLIQPL